MTSDFVLSPVRFRYQLCVAKSHPNYDILCLSETWLVDEVPNDALFLNNYEIIRSDRKSINEKTKHGGVLIAIRKNGLSFLVIDSKQDECVTIKIETNTSVLFCVAYITRQKKENIDGQYYVSRNYVVIYKKCKKTKNVTLQ